MKLRNHPATVPVLACAAGVVNGGLVGYLIGRRKSDEVIEAVVEIVEEVREDPNQFVLALDKKEDEVISFDRSTQVILSEEQAATMAVGEQTVQQDPDHPAVRAALGEITRVETNDEGDLEVDAVLNEEGQAAAEAAAEEYVAHGPRATSVFDSPYGVWDYNVETLNRGDKDPYPIHMDEFEANEHKLRQTSLTYYAGDNIMVDEDNVPVSNFEEVTGEIKFGYGSRNEDIAYVRNPRLDAEYEITRDYDSYLHAVHGLEAEIAAEAAEIRHSHQPRRMRQDD